MPRTPVRTPIPKEESLAETYHANTKVHPYQREAESARAASFPPSTSLRYGGARRLPPPRAMPARLDETLRARRSRREMGGGALALDQLSALLASAYGVTGEDGGRAAPSAGGRYPLELYAAALRVDGLEPGLWHYLPEENAVEPVRAGDLAGPLGAAFLGQDWVERASLVVLVGGVLSRTSVKYGERGYRLMLLDAGHAMQNLLLAATALDLAATSLGGFVDDELNALCMLDAVDENVLYAAAVGPR